MKDTIIEILKENENFMDDVDSITITLNDKEGKSLKIYMIYRDGTYEG